MSNWFEDNAIKSIVIYTLVISGATWGASTFILQDNRLNLAKAELEQQKSIADQYKAKLDIVQNDVATLRAENAEYREWLSKIPNAVPLVVPEMEGLKKKIGDLSAENQKLRAVQNNGGQDGSASRSGIARKGVPYIDDETGLIVTVKNVTVEDVAKVAIQFPDQAKPVEADIDAGKRWSFKSNGHNYTLLVTEISFFGDSIDLRLSLQP